MLILVDEQIHDLDLEVKSGEKLSLRLACLDGFRSADIHVKVQKDGVFDGAFADFSRGSGTFKLVIELLEEGASATWHFAGTSHEEDRKNIDASVEHLARNTSADIAQYGIALDQSRLTFIGTSHIHQGQKGSATAQKEKIIVFDKGAVGKCSPILRIDENDVSASHSAIVGKLSDEHLFYMLSRGIDLDSAKRLLTLGYLKPVLEYYEGELLQRLTDRIEGGF